MRDKPTLRWLIYYGRAYFHGRFPSAEFGRRAYQHDFCCHRRRNALTKRVGSGSGSRAGRMIASLRICISCHLFQCQGRL